MAFEQVSALGELTIRWTGDDTTTAEDLVTDEFDGSPEPADAAPPPDDTDDSAHTQHTEHSQTEEEDG